MLDLTEQYRAIEKEVLAAVEKVLSSQRFILGPQGEGLEQEVAQYVGTADAVGVASGTDALILTLTALGVGPGDEVITTPFSFFATASSIARVGARPVFVDIEPDTFNLDPGKIERAITSRTRAILPVHLFGHCAEFAAIEKTAAARSLPIIEDAAQAIGASYHGRRAGSLGTAACFSFFPTKNLGGAGDGGLVATSDRKLSARLRRLRVHGSVERYRHEEVGFNSRLDELQAAVLRVKLGHLDAWNRARRDNAERYRRLFREAGIEEEIRLPVERTGSFHIYHQFVIRTGRRDALRDFLQKQRIGNEIYYPVPLHLQPAFHDLGYHPGDFPAAESAADEALALPIYPELGPERQQRVVEAVRQFFRSR